MSKPPRRRRSGHKNPNSETEISKRILALLHTLGIHAWRQNTLPIPIRKAGKLVGLRPANVTGISDILGCLAPGGQLLAFEVKRPGECATDLQREFLDAVAAAGGCAAVVCSEREALDNLRAYAPHLTEKVI